MDSFIPSRFVHIREPEGKTFRLALDISRMPQKRIVYFDDTPILVRIAEGLGIRIVLQTDCETTRDKSAVPRMNLIK